MDQEAGFMVNFINSYFIALGVLIGGALIGGLGAYLAGEPPLTAITKLASIDPASLFSSLFVIWTVQECHL